MMRKSEYLSLARVVDVWFEAESAEDLDSPPVLEYGRRPCTIIDDDERPDAEEEVVTEEPGVRHAEGVAEPAIEESFV